MPGSRLLTLLCRPVSVIFTQSAVVQREIYLLERIDAPTKETLLDVDAVVFVRPDPVCEAADSYPSPPPDATWLSVVLFCLCLLFSNYFQFCCVLQKQLSYLGKELASPRFRHYHVAFSNSISDLLLQELAATDVHHVVQSVTETYADFVASDAHVFSLNRVGVRDSQRGDWHPDALVRCRQGLQAVVAGLNLRPAVRFQAGSNMCEVLARELTGVPLLERQQKLCTVLVLDRQADPVTPLLNQWTYQAMVHELLGIEGNRVDLTKSGNSASLEVNAVVLSSEDDEFFRRQMYVTYGELLPAVSRLAEEYKKTKESQQVQTLEGMKQFIKNYAQYKAVSSNTARHVATVLQLKSLCERYHLLGEDGVALLETEILAKNSSAGTVFKRIHQLLLAKHVRQLDKARLIMLFAVRFGHSHEDKLAALVAGMTDGSVEPAYCAAVQNIMRYIGKQKVPALDFLHTDLYKPDAELSNDLLQHTPLLSTVS